MGEGGKKLEIFPCFPKHCLLGAYLELLATCKSTVFKC